MLTKYATWVANIDSDDMVSTPEGVFKQNGVSVNLICSPLVDGIQVDLARLDGDDEEDFLIDGEVWHLLYLTKTEAKTFIENNYVQVERPDSEQALPWNQPITLEALVNRLS